METPSGMTGPSRMESDGHATCCLRVATDILGLVPVRTVSPQTARPALTVPSCLSQTAHLRTLLVARRLIAPCRACASR